jgi:phage terminase large subunit-like protein
LRQHLDKLGAVLPLVPFVQGWKSFSPAVAAFEVAATESRIVHGAHPVLRWCIANTTLVHAPGAPAQNRKPEKRRLYGRIDLAVAALMAIGGLKVSGQTPIETAALIA